MKESLTQIGEYFGNIKEKYDLKEEEWNDICTKASVRKKSALGKYKYIDQTLENWKKMNTFDLEFQPFGQLKADMIGCQISLPLMLEWSHSHMTEDEKKAPWTFWTNREKDLQNLT